MSQSQQVRSRDVFPFLCLPGEIRNQIYSYLVDEEHPDAKNYAAVFWNRYCQNEWVEEAPYRYRDPDGKVDGARCFCYNSNRPFVYHFLRVSRQVRAEAAPIFDNHFHTYPSIDMALTFLLTLGRERLSELKRLDFVHTFSCRYWMYGFRTRNPGIALRGFFRIIAEECHGLEHLIVRVDAVLRQSIVESLYREIKILDDARGIKTVEFLELDGVKEDIAKWLGGKEASDEEVHQLQAIARRMTTGNRPQRKNSAERPKGEELMAEEYMTEAHRAKWRFDRSKAARRGSGNSIKM